jgi:hypothetical protein
MRMNPLKSRAMNWGPLSVMIRGRSPGYFSNARCTTISVSNSFMVSRISQWTM